MVANPTISLVIPAYNEAGNIAATLTDTVAFFDENGISYEIIVSADGNDGTREIASRAATTNPNIIVIGSEDRQGKGKGVRCGVEKARGTYIGYMDADRNCHPREFLKLLPKLKEGNDVVIGSRAAGGALFDKHRALHRRIGSLGFRFCTHLITGLWEISDTQCGFKFFQHDAAKNLFTQAKVDGYSFDVELLFLAKRAGYKIAQVPVEYHDPGDTRMQLVSSNIQTMRDLLRIRSLHRKD